MRAFLLLVALGALLCVAQAKVSFTSASERVVTQVGLAQNAELEGRVIAEAEDAATAEEHSMVAAEQRLSNAILSHNSEAQELLADHPEVKPQLAAISDVAADLILAQGIAKKLAKKEKLGAAVTPADRRKLRLALGFNKAQFKVLKKQASSHGWKKVSKAFNHITKGFEGGFSRAVHKNLARAKVEATSKVMAKAKAAAKGLYDDTEWSGRLLDDPNQELLSTLKKISERYGLTKIPLNTAEIPEEVKAHPVVKDGKNWVKYHRPIHKILAENVRAAAMLNKERQLSWRERSVARRERRLAAASLINKIKAAIDAGVHVPSSAYVVHSFLEESASYNPQHASARSELF